MLRAVTFDFWSTLVDGALTPARFAQRVARLHAALVGAGHACSAEALGAAVQRTIKRVDDEARETLVDVGPPGRWAALAAELGIPDGLVAFEVFETAYEELTYEPLPDPMPHVHVAVQAMQRAGYRLGVICNTGMVGGRTLREVLKRHQLFHFFDVTVFSNEFGYSKPHPAIFLHTLAELGGIAPNEALHVGDLEELDVEGARRAGLHAARYVPESDPGSAALYGQITTDADLVVRDWREFADQVANYVDGVKRGR
jgi:putative hydrolase of the HAD superfamily